MVRVATPWRSTRLDDGNLRLSGPRAALPASDLSGAVYANAQLSAMLDPCGISVAISKARLETGRKICGKK